MNKSIPMLSAVATLLVASAVQAQAPGGGPGASPQATIDQMMTNNDANKDGVITKEEATKANLRLIAAWDTYDLNKDGKVDSAEITKALAAQQGGGAGGAAPAAPAAPQPAAPPAAK